MFIVFFFFSSRRRHTRYISVTGVQTCALPICVGNTYFVRTSGNDANDGLTVNTAFATIQKAVNSCTTAGNTIYIGQGTYSEMVEIGINNGTNAGSGTANDPNKIIGDYTGQYTGDGSGPVIIVEVDCRLHCCRLHCFCRPAPLLVRPDIIKNASKPGKFLEKASEPICISEIMAYFIFPSKKAY